MTEAINDSNRELNMLQFGENSFSSTESIQLIGLEASYTISEPIEFQIRMTGPTFDCGDFYITIYKISNSTKQIITQSGFLNQCYSSNDNYIPIGEVYSEILSEVGSYEILIEINDKTYKQTSSHTQTMVVN